MYIEKVRNYYNKIKTITIAKFNDVKLYFSFLKENNMAQAFDFFETGLLDECENRLRIIVRLWPDDQQAKYLLSVVYVIERERIKAHKLLKSINNYEPQRVEKMLYIIKNSRLDRIFDKYVKTFNLQEVESEIDKL